MGKVKQTNYLVLSTSSDKLKKKAGSDGKIFE